MLESFSWSSCRLSFSFVSLFLPVENAAASHFQHCHPSTIHCHWQLHRGTSIHQVNFTAAFYTLLWKLHPRASFSGLERRVGWLMVEGGKSQTPIVCVCPCFTFRGLGTPGFGRWSCMAHSEGLHVSGGLHVGYCIAWDIIFLFKVFQSSWTTTVLPALPSTSLLILQFCLHSRHINLYSFSV